MVSKGMLPLYQTLLMLNHKACNHIFCHPPDPLSPFAPFHPHSSLPFPSPADPPHPSKQPQPEEQQQKQQINGTSKNKRPRNKKNKDQQQPDTALTLNPEEGLRRQRQRELRDLAIRLREQGQTYNPKKYRRKAQEELVKGHKPRRVGGLQLIIIPIFWNRNPEEKQLVITAANSVRYILRQAGLRVDIDSSTLHTPGQKYREWEEKGVLLRVELGPQEAERGVAVVAQCKTPGEVAVKKTYRVGKKLLNAVKRGLGMEVLDDDGEEEEEVVVAAPLMMVKGRGRESKIVVGGGSSKHIIFSGDDLAGDFGGGDEEEDEGGEEGEGSKKKKKH